MTSFQEIIDELSKVDIKKHDSKIRSKVHNWLNYVPSDWKNNWQHFTERERQIIAFMAKSQADGEEWD